MSATTTIRLCSKCKEHPRAGKSSWCTGCRREHHRAYWNSLPVERRREYAQRKREKPAERWRNSRRAAGLMTEEQYDQQYLEQAGCCALCTTPCDVLVIDHCHTKKVVRGLLCSQCNVALGMLKDDPDLLRRAADYLEKHR